MERILVAIDNRHGGWGALSHACSLAQRMSAELHVLLIVVPDEPVEPYTLAELQSQLMQRVMLHIEKAKNKGIQIHTYITEGNYADEIVSFTTNNNISLFISEKQMGVTTRHKREADILEALRHRLSCRMEVVAQKQKSFL